ncbi:alpha/beta fold hydrolase [Neolewinella aurantiaca]|uniref:Alpha/beta fold hydrolase n=1 Tax=Neolewinella aurantiaca TaxID=2602767 RepID=A0A5C7FSE1_9BACT|nr:alpha/beta fold hydrolase [Neolewinella aurantiaca]TXF88388.1 alpha/beta fold hydrolase [Neolewinella aurantiaca]
MRKLLFSLAALLVVYLGITWFFSGLILNTPDRDIATVYRMNQDRWQLDLDSLQRNLPPREEMSFASPVDGITLKGWLYRPDTVRCGVVMAHGYSVNRANMLKYAPVFDSCGCALLLYDHRGHGESAPEAFGSGGYHEATDLIAANDWLRQTTGLAQERIGWFGESWGGATVLLAAARQGAPRPAWVVSESSFADWESAVMERGLKEYGAGLNALTPGAFAWTSLRAGVDFDEVSPVLAAPKIDVPVLLVHSAADTLTYPVQFDELAKAFKPGVVTARKLDWGAWHAHNIIWRREEYTGMVLDFVGDWCD